MAAIGGPLESVTIGARTFAVTADSDAKISVGGYSNEMLPNGNGSGRQIKSRMLPSVKALSIQIDDSLGDLEFLQELANAPEYFTVSLTTTAGQVWQGSLQVSGEIEASTATASAELELIGQGVLTQQS